MRRCVICDDATLGYNWVCLRCYRKWQLAGKKPKDWPEWIRALAKIERRNERVEQEIDTIPLEEYT